MNIRTILVCLLATLSTLANAEILFDLDRVEVVRLRQRNRLLDWSNQEANLLGLSDVSSEQITYIGDVEKRTKRHYWSWKNDSYESTDSRLIEHNDALAMSFTAEKSKFKLVLKNNSNNNLMLKIDTLGILFKAPFTKDELVTLNNEEQGRVLFLQPGKSDSLFFKTSKGQFVFDENIYGGTDFSFTFSGISSKENPFSAFPKQEAINAFVANKELYETMQQSNDNKLINFEATYYMSVIANTRNTK